MPRFAFESDHDIDAFAIGDTGRWPSEKSRKCRDCWRRQFVRLIIAGIAVVIFCGRARSDSCILQQAASETATRAALPNRRRRGMSKRIHRDSGEIVAASYARVSTNLQPVESMEDQQHACRQAASQKGHQLLPAFEFSDYAVSGKKRRRPGLDSLLRAAEKGEFQVLYVFSLSRLARESVISMSLLKRLVSRHGIRVISLAEGMDTITGHWELVASVMSVAHERYAKDFHANARRGQAGTFLAGLSVGDYCYGYLSEPIPGSETVRPGQAPRPKKRYVIDPVRAPWVQKIFHWFVVERRTMIWIARELNSRKAPKHVSANMETWETPQVARILRNEKYVGIWIWGKTKTVRDPETGLTHVEPRPNQEKGMWVRQFPELAIVDKDIFNQAQRLLRENDARAWQCHHRDGPDAPRGAKRHGPKRLLPGLIRCAACGGNFGVSKAGARFMICQRHTVGSCHCRTSLLRLTAEQIVLREIGKFILADPLWCAAIHGAARRSWEEQTQRVPQELKAAARELRKVDRAIEHVMNELEEGEANHDASRRLRTYRAQRRVIKTSIQKLRKVNAPPGPSPDENWVHAQLFQLDTLLADTSPAPRQALRNLICGQIVVREMCVPGRRKRFLRGRFQLNLPGRTPVTWDADRTERKGDSDPTPGVIEVDFVPPDPRDAQAQRAAKLRNQGLIHKEIAHELGCSTWKVHNLLNDWPQWSHSMLNSEAVDVVAESSHERTHVYQSICEDAKRLLDEGLSKSDIGRRLGCSPRTVRAALAHWYKLHGLNDDRGAPSAETP